MPVNTPQGRKTITLLDVAYIPGFMTNLVSLSRLVKRGVHWNTETGQLSRDGKVLCSVSALDGHWTITTEPTATPEEPQEEPSAFPIQDSSLPRPHRALSAQHWHNIMGHASQEAIRRLPSACTGVQITQDNAGVVCESCRLAKATAIVSRRPGQEEQADRPFARVSYDLIQMTEAYNSDNWVSHFKCYRTGMNHVFTHPRKSDATDIIKAYSNLINNRYPGNYSIRFIRLDGERALGKAFENFAKDKGISIERTATYTPAQNGHAERAGRTLITVARAIRIYAGLPSNLWPELVRLAGYLLNRLPMQGLGWKTPSECLKGIRPSLAHLFIAGCKAYSLIHGIARKDKLAPRASIGYLVGYDLTNLYRI